MPDLGKYALEVTTAYAATFAILAILILTSWAKSRRTKRALDQAEAASDD